MSSHGATIFCAEKTVLNVYGDGYYQKYTCSVCNGTWTNNNSNDPRYQSHHCGHMYNIVEWDGTKDTVHALIDGETVHMIYSNGLYHIITKSYFFDVLQARYVSHW